MDLIHLQRVADGRTMTYRVASPLKPYEETTPYTASGSNA